MVILRSQVKSTGNTRAKFTVAAGVAATLMITPLVNAEGPHREENVSATAPSTTNTSPPNTVTNTTPPVQLTTPPAQQDTYDIRENQLTLEVRPFVPWGSGPGIFLRGNRRRQIVLRDEDTGIRTLGFETIYRSEHQRFIGRRGQEQLERGSTRMEPRRTEYSTRMGTTIAPEQERLMQLLRGRVAGATVVGSSYNPGTPVTSTPRPTVIPGDVRYDISLGNPSLNLIIVGSNDAGVQRYYLGVQIGPRPSGTSTERTEWSRTENLQLRETIRMIEITDRMRATGYAPNTQLRFTGDELVIYAADSQGRIVRAVHDSNNAYGIGISISYGTNYSDGVSVGGRPIVEYGPWTTNTNRQ